MIRLLILLFSFSLIGCCSEHKILNNGLTKKATHITEYTIKFENDSLNNKIQDTLIITEKRYNENDQIISRYQQNLFTEETMNVEFIYNSKKKIKREVVTLSKESLSFIVDYFYRDTLLIGTKSESEYDKLQFKQIGEYIYNSDNKLKESSLKQITVEAETADTIINALEMSTYNDNEFITESNLIDFIKPERNRKTEYKYNCRILIEIREYNSKDSLVSKTEYIYEFDKFENWIKRESIQNDTLKYIRTRKIKYK